MMNEIHLRTLQDWYNFCRDICEQHFVDKPVIFNEGVVKTELQIYESIYGKKRKYNKGKKFKKDSGFLVFQII